MTATARRQPNSSGICDRWRHICWQKIVKLATGHFLGHTQRDADHYEHIAEVPTAYRAKSSIFVPELKRLYVADSDKGKPDAKLALQIFEAQ